MSARVWEWMTWRGCRFVPFPRLTEEQQRDARARFSSEGRRGPWRSIEAWAFAVRKDGRLSRCPYIEPVG